MAKLPSITPRSMAGMLPTCRCSCTSGAARVKASMAAWMRAAGLLAVLSNSATASVPPMRWCMSSTPARKPSTAASRRSVSSYTRWPSAVSAKPARPRRHSVRPRRVSRSLMCRLTVLVPMFSSSSAADKPPHSTTALKTCNRRRSMSLTWPSTARARGWSGSSFTCMNAQPNLNIGLFDRLSTALTMTDSPHSGSRFRGDKP